MTYEQDRALMEGYRSAAIEEYFRSREKAGIKLTAERAYDDAYARAWDDRVTAGLTIRNTAEEAAEDVLLYGTGARWVVAGGSVPSPGKQGAESAQAFRQRGLNQPAPQAGAAEVEKWVASLSNELDRETERAISQRDVFLKTGVSTASHGGSHDTCFSCIIRQHLTTFPLVPTEQPSQIIPQGLTPEEIRQYIIQSTDQPSQDAERWQKLASWMRGALPMVRVQVMYRGQYRVRSLAELVSDIDAARAAQAQTKVKQT